MKKIFSAIFAVALLCSACHNEYNAVFKVADSQYKYEYAKECFARAKYARAAEILEQQISFQKGSENAEESLYMLGMAQYMNQDYESAQLSFSKYFATYTKGIYAELACYYKAMSLYMCTPEPRLDQSETRSAIKAFQDFIDIYPDAMRKEVAQDYLEVLQDKLVRKELYNAQLYYDLGTYFGNCTSGGNNYEACIITAQNALRDYPSTELREKFSLLVMKGKFELANMSVEERAYERYQDAEDECYGFINEYPDSKDVSTAEKYIAKCKVYTSKHAPEY